MSVKDFILIGSAFSIDDASGSIKIIIFKEHYLYLPIYMYVYEGTSKNSLKMELKHNSVTFGKVFWQSMHFLRAF